MSGNRPASGARRATPGEVLSQGFQGAQNAGDFLGLDTEFTASQDPNQVFGSGSPLDLVAPPSTYVDDGSQGGYAPEPAPLPAGDPVQEFAQAPSAFEFGEDLGSDEGEAALDQQGAPSRRPLLVKALLVATLVGGSVYYGPKLYTRFSGSSREVAVAPAALQPKSKGPDAPVADASGKAAPDAAPAAKGQAPEAAPTVAESTPGAGTQEPRKPAVTPRAPSTSTLGPSARKTEPESNPAPGRPDDAASLPSTQGASTAPRTRTAGFPDLEGPEYAWTSEDELEMIWRGSQVPLEAVQARAKTLMPRVGNVRVFTTAGDVFEGRLYAVGQNRVWVDAEPGRIGLDGDRIQKIDVLAPLADGLETTGGVAPQGGKRVRVRVPGGALYGRVLKSEGEDVILSLDDGGRVRVKAGDIEELGPGRAVVVRR